VPFDATAVNLDQLFSAVASRASREAERQRLRELTLAAGAPLTGGWYWVPLREGEKLTWHVQAFYDCWLSPSDHVRIWRHVRDALEHHWRLRLSRIECYALPRGRVSRRADNGIITIYHGRDAPRGSGGLAAVRRAFHLPRLTPATFDEHEQCIAGQPQALERALDIRLGVRGIDASTLDWS
jgi:hypothetical protein